MKKLIIIISSLKLMIIIIMIIVMVLKTRVYILCLLSIQGGQMLNAYIYFETDQ